MMLEIPSYSALSMPQQDLIRIKGGIETAKTYPTRPNSRIALFDQEDDVFYIVGTDVNNYKNELRRFRFIEEPIEGDTQNYASKEDVNSLKEELANVQQSIQQLTDTITNRNSSYTGKRKPNRHYDSENGTIEATIIDG